MGVENERKASDRKGENRVIVTEDEAVTAILNGYYDGRRITATEQISDRKVILHLAKKSRSSFLHRKKGK
jgi:hypothetical protein